MIVRHKQLSFILFLGLYIISSPASLASTDPFSLHFAQMDQHFAQIRESMRKSQESMMQNATTVHVVSPSIQTTEDETKYTVTITLANLDQNSLDIQLENKTLKIKAEQKTETQTASGKSASYSAFVKNVFLPQAGDSTGLDVQTEGDAVIITVPKLSTQAAAATDK
jgi:HSP20 family molecular chaperone IbpA